MRFDHKRARVVAILGLGAISLGSPAFAAAKERERPSDTPALVTSVPTAGRPSPYTDFLKKLSESWPPLARLEAGPVVGLKGLSNAENPLYIGVEHSLRIEAPLATVIRVLDDFEHYHEIFQGYREIRVLGREENRVLTYWRQIVPIAFVSDIRYQTIYFLDKAPADRKIYRMALFDSKDLIKSDGLIVVEAAGPTATRYSELDFWDAEWGIAKHFAPTTIWHDSLEGVALSDLDVKFRAEQPNWSPEKAHEAAKAALKSVKVDEAVKARQLFRSTDYLK